MIRRRVGNAWWLITQDDHARLSGALAAAFGNGLYAPPAERERVAAAVALHDRGWPSHDAAPHVDDHGKPLDVFETPKPLAYALWQGGVDAAVATDAYAGLLVSLHVLHLAGFDRGDHAHATNRAHFEHVRFCQRQYDLQGRLRQALGLAVERPLHGGLAADELGRADPREQVLQRDFRLLQACDTLSLNACCTRLIAPRVGPLPRSPGGSSLPLAVERADAQGRTRLTVHPWPFEGDSFEARVPFRRIPARPLRDAEALAAALAAAAVEMLAIELGPRP